MRRTGLLKIAVIADNRALPGFVSEHGFSLWIETDAGVVLFDTGQGSAFEPNAASLGLHLDRVKAVVLSHGHYDHTGSLIPVLTRCPQARIYLHPDAFKPKYSRHDDQSCHAIGMPESVAKALENHRERLVFTTRPIEVIDGIHTTGEIARETSFEDTGGNFFLDQEGHHPDRIPDDQALWVETSQGVVVLLGCAHSGVVNTLDNIARHAGLTSFHAVIGGMHLARATSERLEKTVVTLQRYNVRRVGPMHCTGPTAVNYLAEQLPDRMLSCSAGTVLEY